MAGEFRHHKSHRHPFPALHPEAPVSAVLPVHLKEHSQGLQMPLPSGYPRHFRRSYYKKDRYYPLLPHSLRWDTPASHPCIRQMPSAPGSQNPHPGIQNETDNAHQGS